MKHFPWIAVTVYAAGGLATAAYSISRQTSTTPRYAWGGFSKTTSPATLLVETFLLWPIALGAIALHKEKGADAATQAGATQAQ